MAFPLYIRLLFYACVLLVFVVFMAGIRKAANQLPNREEHASGMAKVVFGLLGWLMITAVFGLAGFFSNFNALPPRPFFLLVFSAILIVLLFRATFFKTAIKHIPLHWFIYIQLFRVPLEIVLYWLYKEGLAPERMTFEGFNFDIISGGLALLIGIGLQKGFIGKKVAIAYNILGLTTVAIVVSTGILSLPSPFQHFTQPPSTAFVAYFPLVWLPGFLVPMAIVFHIASIKQLIGRKKD